LAVTIDGGDVLGLELGLLVARVDAEAFEHADQGLAGEDGGIGLSPVPLRADDEAVADQLVVADAFDVGDVLDQPAPQRARRTGAPVTVARRKWCKEAVA
jgi:hypothetical protein